MRTLVLTNDFSAFAGSEIVALEVAQWFRDQGDQVTLGANYINSPIKAFAAGITLSREIEALPLCDFDLVWCQHDLLALLPTIAFERASAQTRLPHVALVSLSPYEPYEHVDMFLARALSAEIFVNSPETGLEVLRRACMPPDLSAVRIFHNSAPSPFWEAANRSGEAPPPLRSVVFVSNHPPSEVLDAIAKLKRAGIKCRCIGAYHEQRLLRPDDIGDADAIITIGKTAVYAIAQRKPVYMYDHFGGDGWLTCDNFEASLAYNFSGRPNQRRLTGAMIANEIIDGYAAAAHDIHRMSDVTDLKRLSLEHHLAPLRQRALLRQQGESASLLRELLTQPQLRIHLETSRLRHAVMKRSYLEARECG